ncbi:MAG: Crp/Fnr family transcriptional regulator [Anaerolineales bacterium]|nr:Crp/Fnr family transcriptional regulator [Anaerolineales bacterium]MCX7754143.1 Crp/Fnr family transcriptional regulator [Anaerolineales bacterium]MDW8278057.1 Crp/Fnr family transcriptional regulator [Anaerolineales bacterium]
MQLLKIEREEKLKTLRANLFFQGLNEASLNELAASMTLRRFERGEVLFWEGDPCAGLHIIQRGSAKLFRVSPMGRQHILRVIQEGDTCNEVPVFDGGVNPVNVEALEETTVWVVDSRAVQALMRRDPVFMQKTIENLSRMLRHLVNMVSEMAFYQVTHRLARLIGELPQEELSGEGTTRWTQDQLAARLGTVREVVARSLRELERSGAICIENRRILIRDSEVLQQWAQPWN